MIETADRSPEHLTLAALITPLSIATEGPQQSLKNLGILAKNRSDMAGREAQALEAQARELREEQARFQDLAVEHFEAANRFGR